MNTLKSQNSQQQGITNYIDVKSINEYSVKVERLGGRVIVQKMLVPGMECFAICLDTERTTALSYGKQIAQLNKRNILIK